MNSPLSRIFKLLLVLVIANISTYANQSGDTLKSLRYPGYFSIGTLAGPKSNPWSVATYAGIGVANKNAVLFVKAGYESYRDWYFIPLVLGTDITILNFKSKNQLFFSAAVGKGWGNYTKPYQYNTNYVSNGGLNLDTGLGFRFNKINPGIELKLTYHLQQHTYKPDYEYTGFGYIVEQKMNRLLFSIGLRF